ncbi:MAG: hypothetical protein ACYDDF_10490 [Thermoplasmatota archaeon]
MGEAARRAYLKRATPTMSFDHGLQLSDMMMQAVIKRAAIDPSLPDRERAHLAYLALRRAQG